VFNSPHGREHIGAPSCFERSRFPFLNFAAEFQGEVHRRTAFFRLRRLSLVQLAFPCDVFNQQTVSLIVGLTIRPGRLLLTLKFVPRKSAEEQEGRKNRQMRCPRTCATRVFHDRRD
jgi:hypothetical protein